MWAYGFINRANPILDVTCYGFFKTKREFCWLELLLAMLDFLLVGPDFLRHFLSILAMAAMGFRWIFRDSENSASMDFEVSEQFPNIKKPLWIRCPG